MPKAERAVTAKAIASISTPQGACKDWHEGIHHAEGRIDHSACECEGD
jgi:hypothetical protein